MTRTPEPLWTARWRGPQRQADYGASGPELPSPPWTPTPVVPEAGAYQILKVVLADLVKAERALTLVQEAAPDAERATHLDHVRTAISAVRAVVAPESEGVTLI